MSASGPSGPLVKYYSQNAHGFINIHEYYYLTVLKFDDLLNILLS